MSVIGFQKVEGTGNDFVLLDGRGGGDVAGVVASAGFGDVVRRLCDRRYGVGADGVLVLEEVEGADVGVRIVNADGSVGGVCVNGLRCVVAVMGEDVVMRMGGRDVRGEIVGGGLVRVGVGMPGFELAGVPVDARELGVAMRVGEAEVYQVGGMRVVFVGTGNPHAVVFLGEAWSVGGRFGDGVEAFDVLGAAREFGSCAALAEGVNVHVAERCGGGRVRVRNFERGAGETLACGSGAVAVVAAGERAGLWDGRVGVVMDGGELGVEVDRGSGVVWVSGAARVVFRGDVDIGSFGLD